MSRTKSAVREVLTDKDINDCLRAAFKALPAEDQENIQAVVDELEKIDQMGLIRTLGLLFAVDQAPALKQLSAAILEHENKGG